MKKAWVIICIVTVLSSFSIKPVNDSYTRFYTNCINAFVQTESSLLNKIRGTKNWSSKEREAIRGDIWQIRKQLKNIDFWLRYLEATNYKKINGPLPVEWENEVFEKFEKPYRREGAGLILAEQYLDEKDMSGDSLARLISISIDAMAVYKADSITSQLNKPDHFFLCNRLYLLNLASIYTTGFECPDSKNIIPELRSMLAGTKEIYQHYNESYKDEPLTGEYLGLYEKALRFAESQPADYEKFDHFSFIKNYVNPLFGMNQGLIRKYRVISQSFNDYTLNNDCNSIFDKGLYTAQNTKGIYSLVEDPKTLAEVKAVGKLLFYDPILSGNNARSCASCHKPTEYFTDTSAATSMGFDMGQRLERNTPTLINVVYNHLLMLDGKHLTLHKQAQDVMTNANEMSSSNEQEILEKVLSCKEYNAIFKKLTKATPEAKEISIEHIISAITYYYGSFSSYYAPFDEAMNNNKVLEADAISGFNLFMSKAQCGTCHYVPEFNGVPAPYIGSEFEVAGTPADTGYKTLSQDKGRYLINPAVETMNAFRTSTMRNTEHTKPYMHNGVFTTMEQVIDFYDAGGGAGRKLKIGNQTVPVDSLKLTPVEKKQLIRFIHSLSENITFDTAPEHLPLSSNKKLNGRKPGGEY